MKNYFFVLCLLALASCSLNAEQEASLNRAVNKHIGALNDGRLVQFIAETYPPAVKYYKSKGDAAFKEKFTLVDSISVYETAVYQDPTILNVGKSELNIHVEYTVLCVTMKDLAPHSEERKLFALSSDGGKQWYFLHDEDYFNSAILPKNDRLINK